MSPKDWWPTINETEGDGTNTGDAAGKSDGLVLHCLWDICGYSLYLEYRGGLKLTAFNYSSCMSTPRRFNFAAKRRRPGAPPVAVAIADGL